MKTLAIDIETYSSVSLQKCGVYAYAQSPDFEILLFGYAWDDSPVEVIDLAKGQSLPQELQDALYDTEILKTAFNASFERTCLSAFMGRVTPPEQWSCTAVMARELGLPGSLEAVGEVIGLPEDKQKSKTGRALIRYFSIPCKPTKTNGNTVKSTLPRSTPTPPGMETSTEPALQFTPNKMRSSARRDALCEALLWIWTRLRLARTLGLRSS